jgi:predicted RNA-binding protein with PIN domain
MRYFVDGYNMLFQSSWMYEGKNLEEARYKLILELDTYAKLLCLSITLVFDAPQREAFLQRTHYQSLEIIFSTYGQTADDVIALLISRLQKKEPITVVTSDKGLTRRAAGQGAKTLSVKEFLSQLRKRARKKLFSTPKPALKPEPVVKKKIPSSKTGLPPLSDLEAWEKIFTDLL